MRKQKEKTVGKSRALINEKSLKLDEETRKKTDHSMYVAEVKNLQNLTKKIERKTWCWLIWE